jgi:hypothetical protein
MVRHGLGLAPRHAYGSGSTRCDENAVVLAYSYRIVVSDGLDDAARDAFSGYRIDRDGDDTALVADLEQAGLFATLARVNSLGLELVEAVRVGRPR